MDEFYKTCFHKYMYKAAYKAIMYNIHIQET